MRTLRLTTVLTVFAGLSAAAACGSSDAGGGGQTPPGTPGSGAPSGSPPASPRARSLRQVVAAAAAAGGGGGGGGTEPAETPIPYVAFDVNHVVSTGQSNSVSHGGIPVLTTSQPFANLSFDVGVMTSGDCEREGCPTYQKPSGFIPLTEGDVFWYPVETMSSGLANEGTLLAKSKYGKPSHDILVSLAGRNGLTYWCLRKGGCNFITKPYVNSFDESMKQVADAKAIATANGKSYGVRVVTSIHGESDDFAYATNTQEFPLDGTDGTSQTIKSYKDGLLEWQRDFEATSRPSPGRRSRSRCSSRSSRAGTTSRRARSASSSTRRTSSRRARSSSSPPATRSTGAPTAATTRTTASAGSASTSARRTRARCSRDSAGSRCVRSR